MTYFDRCHPCASEGSFFADSEMLYPMVIVIAVFIVRGGTRLSLPLDLSCRKFPHCSEFEFVLDISLVYMYCFLKHSRIHNLLPYGRPYMRAPCLKPRPSVRMVVLRRLEGARGEAARDSGLVFDNGYAAQSNTTRQVYVKNCLSGHFSDQASHPSQYVHSNPVNPNGVSQ